MTCWPLIQTHSTICTKIGMTSPWTGCGLAFEAIWHQPFDKNDEQAPLLDLTPHAHRQFIFYDTGQYYQLKTTRWAWMNCHALILPVSPHMDQLGNFEHGIETYQTLPGTRRHKCRRTPAALCRRARLPHRRPLFLALSQLSIGFQVFQVSRNPLQMIA
jgi:hypothetical protein